MEEELGEAKANVVTEENLPHHQTHLPLGATTGQRNELQYCRTPPPTHRGVMRAARPPPTHRGVMTFADQRQHNRHKTT